MPVQMILNGVVSNKVVQ